MSELVKSEIRMLSIYFGKSFIFFIVVFALSANLLIKHWDLWPVFLILALWILVMDKPVKLTKLPYAQSSKLWGENKKFGTSRVLLWFTSSLLHSLFTLFLTFVAIKFYTILKPELSTTLANQISPSLQRLSLSIMFVGVMFFSTLALAISIYGDYKKLTPNKKSTIFLIIFFAFEIIVMRLNVYINLILSVVAIAICLILAIVWIERITKRTE